jgi:inhibitor of KinA sporulation pathway (predicted exonuclease)
MITRDAQEDRALYLDLEWTCWDAPPPPGMQQEIIEIGIVEMDVATLDIIHEASYFVRPRRWEISHKCSILTGIKDQDIQRARRLSEVLDSIQQAFQPSDKVCCTWGDDVSVMARACHSIGMKNPFRRPIDVAKVFQGAFVLREQASLTKAIAMMNMKFEGGAHGALSDARNTAQLHASMLRRLRLRGEPLVPLAVEQNTVIPLSPFGQKLKQSLSASRKS